MKKILIIRDKTINFSGGIKKHCDDLQQLMQSSETVSILPIEDVKSHFVQTIRKQRFDNTALRTYIATSDCDIVHIHGFASLGVIQTIKEAKRANKQIVYSPHFHPFEYLNNPSFAKLFFYILLKPLLKYVDTIVTINNEDTPFWQKYHRNVVQVPHWIEDVEDKTVDKVDNMILFVGRNDNNKGLEHLYRLPKDRYQIHCVTKGKLERNDFIQHMGISNEDLDTLYRKASLLVVPSRYEAFSLVALEALSRGCPVVISDRVRIGDYLHNKPFVGGFKYHDFESFISAVDKTIGEKVDMASINQIFDRVSIAKTYEHSVYNI